MNYCENPDAIAYCTISQDCPDNADVVGPLSDGHCYDREQIAAWMRQGGKSPFSSKPFTEQDLEALTRDVSKFPPDARLLINLIKALDRAGKPRNPRERELSTRERLSYQLLTWETYQALDVLFGAELAERLGAVRVGDRGNLIRRAVRFVMEQKEGAAPDSPEEAAVRDAKLQPFGEDCPAARAVAELARLIEEGWPELDPAYREKSCPPLAEAVATFREVSSVKGAGVTRPTVPVDPRFEERAAAQREYEREYVREQIAGSVN